MTYFKPLRRKFGIVALLSACLFVGMWMRSSTYVDCADLLGRDTYRPFLASSKIGISVFITPETFFKWASLNSHGEISQSDQERFPFIRYDGRWRWKWYGFRYGDAEYQCGPHPHANAFWVLVIPHQAFFTLLTALSAYLLLSKPRSPVTPSTNAGNPPV